LVLVVWYSHYAEFLINVVFFLAWRRIDMMTHGTFMFTVIAWSLSAPYNDGKVACIVIR